MFYDRSQPASAGDLPSDCLRLIFSHLPLRDKCAATATCRSWELVLREAGPLWADVAVDHDSLQRACLFAPIGEVPGSRRQHWTTRFFARRGPAIKALAVHDRRIAPPPSPQQQRSSPARGVAEFLHFNLPHVSALTHLDLVACPASAVATVASCRRLEGLRIGRLVFEAEAVLYAMLLEDASASCITAVLSPLAVCSALRRLHVHAYRTADDCILATSCGSVPGFLAGLPRLQQLTLPNISQAAGGSAVLPTAALRSLALTDCGLPLFPEQLVTQCTVLEELSIDFAVQLDPADVAVPRSISQLAHSLTVCELSHVPSHLRHLSTLTRLHSLALHDCGLFAWPDWLHALPVLRALSLRDNSIAHVPRSVSGMTALASLDLSCNGCRLTLPAALAGAQGGGALTRLTWGPGLHAEEMEVYLETRQGVCVRVDPCAGWQPLPTPALSALSLSTLAECCAAAVRMRGLARERLLGECEAERAVAVMVLT